MHSKIKFSYLFFVVIFVLFHLHIAFAFVLPQANESWTITKNLVKENNVYVFQAKSKAIVDECKAHPDYFLAFPTIMEVSQVVMLDNAIVDRHGSPNLDTLKSYYGAPLIRCKTLVAGKELIWNVYSLTKDFARIRNLPYLSPTPPFYNLIQETFNIVAVGALIILALFCIIVFHNKIEKELYISLFMSSLITSVFFVLASAGYFNIYLPALTQQKISDSCLILGVLLYFNSLKASGIISKKVLYLYLLVSIVGLFILLTANNLDTAQLGTSTPFIPMLAITIYVLIKQIIIAYKNRFNLYSLLLLISFSIFAVTAINDILYVQGYIDSYAIFSIGFISGLLFFIFAINYRINDTYLERDTLQLALAEEKARSKEEARRLQWLQMFARFLRHELKNSLLGISTSLKLMRMHNKNNASETYINRSEKALGFINSLLDSVTTANTLETALITEQREIINIADLVKDSIENYKHIYAENIFELSFASRKLLVSAHTERLLQMFDKVLTNAVEHCIPGTPIIIEVYKKNNDAYVEISNEGSTIEDKTGVFDLFTSSKINADDGNYGMGLYFVKLIVENYDGQVVVKDLSQKKGTMIQIMLPILELDSSIF